MRTIAMAVMLMVCFDVIYFTPEIALVYVVCISCLHLHIITNAHTSPLLQGSKHESLQTLVGSPSVLRC